MNSDTGIVIIGRNEGARLKSCLRSLESAVATIVYVDSGSTDGSVEFARANGIHVIDLPLDNPFTAGRARNAGFRALMELEPGTRFVQFVDGDCTVENDWIRFAREYLQNNNDFAIVCGRRREMHPEHTVFNRLCDIEWDTPIGEAEASGGDFMARTDAFSAVDGFNDSIIAGEEPEMCYRLRKNGWRIYRADKPMTQHDAAIERLGQWYRRTSRSGYAYAARAALHWGDGGRYCLRENMRIAFWAFAVPATVLALSVLVSKWCLIAFAVYPVHWIALRIRMRRSKPIPGLNSYCFFVILSKWPEFSGQMLYLSRRLRRQSEEIIEYKS